MCIFSPKSSPPNFSLARRTFIFYKRALINEFCLVNHLGLRSTQSVIHSQREVGMQQDLWMRTRYALVQSKKGKERGLQTWGNIGTEARNPNIGTEAGRHENQSLKWKGDMDEEGGAKRYISIRMQ